MCEAGFAEALLVPSPSSLRVYGVSTMAMRKGAIIFLGYSVGSLPRRVSGIFGRTPEREVLAAVEDIIEDGVCSCLRI